MNRHDGMSRKSLLQEPNLQVSRSLSQPITTLNHIYHLLSRLTVSRCTSHGVLTCRKSSCNEKFEPQFDEEPQCIHIETATYHADTTLHGRTHRVPPHPIWRSTVHTENDRFRSHGQILPTLRQLDPQNSESRIRQSIFLAGEITSIQKKFFSDLTFSTVIPNIIFPLILGLKEA